MRTIIPLFILAISACGFDSREKVQTGDFEVKYIFNHYESAPNTQCDNSKQPGDTHKINWTIFEEDGVYKIDADDNDNERVVYATSRDGYIFNGSAGVAIFNCMFNVDWEISLDYGDDPGFIGTENDTLTLSCEAGFCSEIWDLVGRPN